MEKPILLSGMKPTGRPHIGNYFGALRQFVDLEREFDAYYMIADYHALNFVRNKEEMEHLIVNMAIDYMAIGLTPRSIFKQSDVPEHTELAWIFETLTPLPYLKRAHAYKDAVAKGAEEKFSVGDFNYPMLMAADILAYDAEVVPIGKDQQQHLEYARDTAERFNRVYGETFVLPNAHILEEVAVVPGVDGRKMSKSYGNTIELFAERSEIQKRVMSIITDSAGGRPENVYAIHALVRDEKQLNALYEENAGNYKALKEALVEDLDTFIAPFRAKRNALSNDRPAVLSYLKQGGERARERASKKLADVRMRIGVAV